MAARKRVLALKKDQHHTSNPQYLSGNMKEYIIKFKELSGWYIHRYHGGTTPKPLRGFFRTHADAERVLILFLMTTDKLGMARWPGKENIRHTNYTRAFLNVTG